MSSERGRVAVKKTNLKRISIFKKTILKIRVSQETAARVTRLIRERKNCLYIYTYKLNKQNEKRRIYTNR